MGDLKTFFDSFKEFIWDIIGYMIPGAYLVILTSFVINNKFLISIPTVFKGNEMLILIVISYVLGYIIYGLGDLKERLRGKQSYSKRILLPILNTAVFIESKEIMKRKDSSNKTFNDKIENIDVRGLRNIVMSYTPEADQKVYTFMFRSELSRHIGLISIIIGTLGLIFSSLKCTDLSIDFFKCDTVYVLLYFMLIFSYYLLREPRDKFYRIAITMPFNLFVAKEKNK